MKSDGRIRHFLLLTILSWALFIVASCAQTTVEPESELATAALSSVEIEAPADVIEARDAALAFLRTSANECVPREGVRWQATVGGDETPAGFGVYRFTADDCTITVSYSLNAVTDTLYHVALGDSVTGFCWQAVIGAGGHVLRTGSAAVTEPDQGNPSAIYCTQQGYTYTVQPQANGVLCGMCVFPDGRACKSWAYFNGQCSPEDAAPPEE